MELGSSTVLLVLLLLQSGKSFMVFGDKISEIRREDFPSDFIFGSGTSAYEKPSKQTLKLNVDGAFSTYKAGYGGCIRNHSGQISWAFLAGSTASSPLLAELTAVSFGLTLCKIVGINNIQVEVDSLWVINILSHGMKPPAQCFQLVANLQKLLRNFNFTFSHTFRQANSIAHLLASIGKKKQEIQIYKAPFLPKKITGLAYLETWELPSIRVLSNV